MASIDKVAERVVDGNQKDEEESHAPGAVDNAEHQIRQGDYCGKRKLVPRTTELGVEVLAMMVKLVVCFLPTGKRLAVDGDGTVGIGVHAMPIVLERIDMHTARPHVHLLTFALVGYVDAIPANMDLFTLARINDMDAAGKGNIDERVVVAVSVFGGILGFFDTIRIVGVGIAVLRCTAGR